MISQSNTPMAGASVNPLQITIGIYEYIWIVGMIALALYTAISYWRLRRKVDTAVLYKDNIFQSENVSSPFVLGIIKPRIYLPFSMSVQDLEHVVAHESAHIRRKDHWWKPLGFLLLTIHWFNPLMWLAYILLCKDIELACDEKAIKEMGNEQRADYTQALVACSVNRRRVAACPLAFGEVGVKERVKSVMNYKKPAFWVIVISVIACVVVAVCFRTNPKDRVQDLMRPGTAWICEEHQLFFTIDEDNVIEGTFTDQNENTTISVGYRFAGKYNAVFDIYRGDWESAQKSTEAPLLAGMLKAQNGTLILEVDKDNIGLGAEQIAFSETDAELSAMNTAAAGKTYLYENEGIMGSFTITLYDDGTFTYYEGMASSYLGNGTWKQEGDTITLTDNGHGGLGVANHFKRDGDDLVFIAENSSNFVYVKVQDGERFHCTGEAFKPNGGVDAPEQIVVSRKLTLDDVLALSEKGYDLTWSDFEDYLYIETGSGLYIRVYEINELFSLWIGGSGPDSDPMYIYLALADDIDTRIDIRDSGVTEFISEYGNSQSSPPAVTKEELLEVFRESISDNGTVITTDCVIATDGVYGLDGVVQYADETGAPWKLAFIRDGAAYPVSQHWSTEYAIASELTYLGNDTVQVSIENLTDGIFYTCTMAYSYDEVENQTNFKSASEEYTPENGDGDETFEPYSLRISRSDIQIFNGPGHDSVYVGTIGAAGTYTIVGERMDAEGNRWGKLKSGIGWIDLTAAQSGFTAPISAVFANDELLSGMDYHEYRADDSEYAVELLFTANEALTDVQFSSFQYENGTLAVVEELEFLSELKPENPFVASVVFYGDMTTYGMSFTDASGVERNYVIYISGRNGALMMEEYDP